MRDSYFLDNLSDKEKNVRQKKLPEALPDQTHQIFLKLHAELKDALEGSNVNQTDLNLALFLQEANLSVEQAKNAILKDQVRHLWT
jgi:hypothetical protein